MANAKIFHGDASSVLKTLEKKSVHTCITSPPYFGLRDYGVEGQIGLEETPEAYVEKLVELFREVRRVLRDDGTLWLNLGDSYAGSGKGGQSEEKRSENWQPEYGSKGARYGLKPKDLIGIPWRVAFALQADGWYLRQDIIWHKPNPMPESVRDRCTKAHEYLFLLSKSPRYYFDSSALKEPSTQREFRHPFGWGAGDEPRTSTELQKEGVHRKTKHIDASARIGGTGRGLRGHSGNRLANGTILTTRNKRSVWTITTKPFKGAHFATFPPELVRVPILASTPPGGIVLDPFAGSGTTLAVATECGRDSIGIELNASYIELANNRIPMTLL